MKKNDKKISKIIKNLNEVNVYFKSNEWWLDSLHSLKSVLKRIGELGVLVILSVFQMGESVK